MNGEIVMCLIIQGETFLKPTLIERIRNKNNFESKSLDNDL